MRRASAALALVLAGCMPHDPKTPEGMAALFVAYVEAENFDALFDQLHEKGKAALKEDLWRIVGEARNAEQVGVGAGEFSSMRLRDAFVKVGRASLANPDWRKRLREHYGQATVAGIDGTETAKRVLLNRKSGGSETVYLGYAEDRWWLDRFPWDWRR